MGYRTRTWLAAGVVLATLAAGCGSSSKPSSSSSGSKTITIGVLADLTGAASADDTTVPQGVKAGVGLAAKEGYHVKYVVADDASSLFGSTNVGPIVLAMKSAGINGFTGSLEENTEFAVINDLRQEGVTLKGALLATGYGGDLALGGPGATQDAQGVTFFTAYEPVELHTSATEQLQSALKTYVGVTSDPTFAEYLGYLSVDALGQGLRAAGPKPTQASFINAMLGITNYNGAGLYGTHLPSFGLAGRGTVSSIDNCLWAEIYKGSSFHLVPGAEPLCGKTIPGLKVSASS